MRKYKIIYADLPWPFKQRSPGTWAPMMNPKKVKNPYPIMEIKELIAMNIEQLASEDCALFMWVVAMYIPDALEIAKARALGQARRGAGPHRGVVRQAAKA